MPLEYIKNGEKQLGAATKIKLLSPIEDKDENPFTRFTLAPESSEALKSGGGMYIFLKLLGFPAAVRRTATPKESYIKYDGIIDTEQVVLNVNYPFETLHYPYNEFDTLIMDGINIPAKYIGKLNSTLAKAQRNLMRKLIVDNDKAKKHQGIGKDILSEVLEMRTFVANWMDLNKNDFWKNEMKYFESFEGYALTPTILMNPRDIVDFTAINTIAGAGSLPQFMEFKNGTLSSFIGFEVVSTPLIPAGDIHILVKTLGVPDPAIMLQKIIDFYDKTTDVSVVWAKKYFDAVQVWPQLCGIFTRISKTDREILSDDEMSKKDKEVVKVILDDDTAEKIAKYVVKLAELTKNEATDPQIKDALDQETSEKELDKKQNNKPTGPK